MTMPFRKNFGIQEGASGVDQATTVRRRCCEYSAGVRNDPLTEVMALRGYGGGRRPDGGGDGQD